MTFFIEPEKKSKFIWNHKRSPIVKVILSTKSPAEYTTETTATWHQHKNKTHRPTQQNRRYRNKPT